MKGVPNVIVGYGRTGQSVASFLSSQSIQYAIADDEKVLGVGVDVLSIDELPWLSASRAIVSPGVPLTHQGLVAAKTQGIELTNDIALFCETVEKPFALITGSNGKSTVTHMVGQLLNGVGIRTGIGGNIGTPCLDLLEQDFDRYVLEVSSYHLELATECRADVACLLNLSPDHLDRYESVRAYYEVKTNVFNGCKAALVSRDVATEYRPGTSCISFGTDQPVREDDFGLVKDSNAWFLVKGNRRLICCSELSVGGFHNWSNLLAAIALAELLGAELDQIAAILPEVSGLAHRCESVYVDASLTVVNDSKSTNPASTVAALKSFANETDQLTLILGGLDKGADFESLAESAARLAQRVYVFGQDRRRIAGQLHSNTNQIHLFETLEGCIDDISTHVDAGVVLFSPACASFDQFENFEQRGDYFKQQAMEVLK